MSDSLNGINKLLDLVRTGSIEEVTELLSKYSDHIKLSSREITPLSVACELNRGDVVDLLLKHGDDPNAGPDAAGRSPLQIACDHGQWNANIVRSLLKAGARVDHQSNDGQTALHLASCHGYADMVSLLLAHYADVTVLDSQKENALCKTTGPAVAKLLIDAGGDVDCKFGLPILNAVTHDATLMVFYLIKAGANLQHDPLVWMAKRKKFDRTRKLLIKAGLSPESGVIRMKSSLSKSTTPKTLRMREIRGSVIKTSMCEVEDEVSEANRPSLERRSSNLLVDLVRDSSLEQLEDFLAQDAQEGHLNFYLRPLDDIEVTPLSVACELNRGDVVKLLLKYGADPNTKSGIEGKAPLHFACEHKKWNTRFVRVLLEAGASVDMQANDGQTALHLASRHGNVEVVGLLLAHYADVTKLDNNQENALCKTESAGVARLLIDAGSDVNCSCGRPILNAVNKGLIDVVDLLIQAGANLNNDPLIWIANRKQFRRVRNRLAKAGISGKCSPIRMKSSKGRSTNPSFLRMREIGMRHRCSRNLTANLKLAS